MKPVAIDLFCGLGGWTEGLLAEGYRVIGFDNERHVYGDARYPAELVLQDVLTLHGAQFKDAALLVASPPCQAYSYRAMPWKRAKALGPPDNSLFEACFRIQREACEAAGRYIPLVVENVCGAQKWVGRARWHYGSFYLWGDVPALMPITRKAIKGNGGPWFKDADTADGAYGPGNFRNAIEGVKVATMGACIHRVHWSAECRECGIWRIYPQGRRSDPGKGARFTSQDCGIERVSFGSGVPGGNTRDNREDAGSDQQHARSIKNGGDWFGSGSDCSLQRRQSSKSNARKAASAHIAKIPLALARHIAKAWKPA